MSHIIGIDTGGTFTDCVVMDAEGRITATTRYSWSNVAAELEMYYLELRGELPSDRHRPLVDKRVQPVEQ